MKLSLADECTYEAFTGGMDVHMKVRLFAYLAEDEHEHNQINLQALDRWYQPSGT